MKKFQYSFVFVVLIFSVAFVIPESHQMPVQGASSKDWNHQSFWYYPWGNNRVHQGIDIFAKENTPVVAPTNALILKMGQDSLGGNIVLLIGAKWRFHYFAHLKHYNKKLSWFVHTGEVLGWVGNTGNAQGKAPHLHYSIRSLFPRFWMYNSKNKKAWSRLFFIDPGKFIAGKV